ncbi:hypothetical protein [Niveibacterium sp. COAC-50]|uniref:hypothetical protein n=1 Tax=Niveibacterium sp. COAC-50 TaxID=2729384 RepID=UPI00155546F5|nr:hypothetical protein [Niveibacterium sp. COAC-50]
MNRLLTCLSPLLLAMPAIVAAGDFTQRFCAADPRYYVEMAQAGDVVSLTYGRPEGTDVALYALQTAGRVDDQPVLKILGAEADASLQDAIGFSLAPKDAANAPVEAFIGTTADDLLYFELGRDRVYYGGSAKQCGR